MRMEVVPRFLACVFGGQGAPWCGREDGWAGRALLNKEVFSDHVASQACARQPGGDVHEICPRRIDGIWGPMTL